MGDRFSCRLAFSNGRWMTFERSPYTSTFSALDFTVRVHGKFIAPRILHCRRAKMKEHERTERAHRAIRLTSGTAYFVVVVSLSMQKQWRQRTKSDIPRWALESLNFWTYPVHNTEHIIEQSAAHHVYFIKKRYFRLVGRYVGNRCWRGKGYYFKSSLYNRGTLYAENAVRK